MRPSTERRWSGSPWQLADISDADLVMLMRIPAHEAAARRAQLIRDWASPARVEEVLAGLPEETLAVLVLLVEAGGVLDVIELELAAEERFGLSPDELKRASVPAMREMLAAPLSAGYDQHVITLIEPAATALAPLVLGLDLPELEGAFVPEPDQTGARQLVAAATMLAHVEIKANQDGLPNRAQVKRCAAQVGMDVARFDDLLLTAAGFGLIAPLGAVLRPRHEAIEVAARGRCDAPPAGDVLRLVVGGPVAIEAVVRTLPVQGRDAAEWLRLIPGLQLGTVGGVPAVTAVTTVGNAAGHVTPSFEVFLPPESPLIDVARVGRFAEVARLDQVITLRITRLGVSRAAVGGLTADEMVAALGAIGRHPVPQNVEAAIRDWAAQSQGATVELGRVVVVGADADVRVTTALAPFAPRRVAPGVFVLSSEIRTSAIDQALRRAGVQVRESAPVLDPPDVPRGPLRIPAASPRLKARFATWRHGRSISSTSHEDHFDDAAMDARMRAAEQALDRWTSRVGHRWKHQDQRRAGLTLALAMLEPSDVAQVLDAPDLRDVMKRLDALLEQLDSSPAKPAAPPSAPPPNASMPERLRALQGTPAPVTLVLRSGRDARVRVLDVVGRGKATMVLAEDVETDVAVAFNLAEIRDLRARWTPTADQPAPPGHVACPCGSGERYRRCCR